MVIRSEHLRAPVSPPLCDGCGRVHSYLRLSVTGRCNLRCSYCMPHGPLAVAGGEATLSSGEIERLARLFAGLGITKLRLTGGEPLTLPGLPELVARLAAVPGIETLALTTNGLLLADLAAALKKSGLTRLNVSLDTLDAGRFREITGSEGLPRVLAGLEAALDAGFSPLKLNMVVMKGVNDDEILRFVELARVRPLHVRFIELMPFGPRGTGLFCGVPAEELMGLIRLRYSLRPLTPEELTDSARRFRIAGFRGTVGFISPLSDPFCAACNRLRVTADGKLKSCLFRPASVDLRQMLRSGADDDALAAQVRAALAQKAPGHNALLQGSETEHRRMHEIGG